MPSAPSPVPRLGVVMPLASQQGGAERLFQNLLSPGVGTFRYDVLFLQDGPLVKEAQSLGYGTTVVETTHLRDVRNYATTVRAIRNWIEHSGIDLVFSWMLKAHLYAGPAAVLARKKRMWFQHGISKRHWMDVAGTCLSADGIVCCSNYVKRTQDLRFPSRPTFTCHPGVTMPVAGSSSKAGSRQQLGLPVDAQVVCMVARLERWKGIHVFIEAARLLSSTCENAIFCVAGGPHPLDLQYAREVEALAIQSGLGPRLRLLGQLPADEIARWHSAADIIVHPVTEAEPFGMAIVEALALGRAVVASEAGGISEILEDGVSGLFVPPGDATALARAVQRLLENLEERERVEAGALIRAQMFSTEAFVARFERLILSVLAA